MRRRNHELWGSELLKRWSTAPSRKGTGFDQPLRPHQHWHIDVAYVNVAGTFYYLCSILDGASRAIVHWEIRETMKEADVECILERARERYPGAKPRIISDNGPSSSEIACPSKPRRNPSWTACEAGRQLIRRCELGEKFRSSHVLRFVGKAVEPRLFVDGPCNLGAWDRR